MFNKKLFNNRLKLLRLEKNLTLEQLGTIFNVSKQAASRWETGDRIPSIELIYKIAEYFNVSLDYLIGRTDNPDLTIKNIERCLMKIKDLISVIFDEVVIYKAKDDDFEDIYKGDKDNIPSDILEMKVRSIGAKRKGVVDIQVF